MIKNGKIKMNNNESEFIDLLFNNDLTIIICFENRGKINDLLNSAHRNILNKKMFNPNR